MEDWRIKPTIIEHSPAGVKLTLFIDESGTPMYKGTTENNRYFTLCGCLFSLPELKKAQDSMLALKEKYWKDGLFAYKKGFQRVTFHMSEIASACKGFSNKNNPFSYIKENVHPFYEEYKQLIGDLDFFVFSVTVDKISMQNSYRHPYDPFAYAFELLLERVHHCVVYHYPDAANGLVIVIESSQRKEDALHHKHIMNVLTKGTSFKDSNCFTCVKGVYFCPKRNTDGKSYYGLEIADFCAYPIKMYHVKKEVGSEEFNILQPKIYRNGSNLQGYGLKKVPKNYERPA